MRTFPCASFLVLFTFLAVPSLIPAQELLPGKILEKVICQNDSDQSYALYLPSSYSPDRKWPILYALDAGARGVMPVRRFQTAAEKYGYIVAGSNNSRNGPIEIVNKAMRALITDAAARFALDSRRVYITGFSGGARVAVSLAAAMKRKIAAVIACGAGFPPEILPSASIAFAFFGAVGVEDFNFPEMRDLDNSLEKSGATHRLEIFKGDHEWPPEAVCTRAIEWLEIQAAKSGIAGWDSGRIDRIYSKSAAEAQDCESRQELYEAYQLYGSLRKDFSGLRNVDEFEKGAARLEKSEAVRKALNQEKEAEERQRRIEEKLDGLMAGTTESEGRAFQLQELIRSLISLRKQADQTSNETDRLVAVRILSLYWVRLNESVSLAFKKKDPSVAALRLELMAQIQPGDPQVYYHLSRAYALSGEKRKAIKALQTALSKGFKDASQLRNNPDFEILKTDAAFQSILKEFRE